MKIDLKKTFEKIKNAFKSKNDPSGSYTGNAEGDEKPTQDADDL